MIQFKFDIAQIFIPLLVWLGLFLMPLITSWIIGVDIRSAWYFVSLLILLLMVVLFYLDYYIFVDKFATIQRWPAFVLINVSLTIAFVAIVELILAYLFAKFNQEMPNFISFSIAGIILFFMSACLSLAVRMSQSYHWNQVKLYEMNKLQTQTELQNLKNQINPHFLFNTLNNIYSLIEIDPSKAQKSIHDLSSMLRYVIYGSSSEKVNLRDEMDFIKDYIKLEGLRLGKNVKCEISMPDNSDMNCMIAPLLIIPFVENAFKHGTSGCKPSKIIVDIKLVDDTLKCHIVNTSYPHTKGSNESGVGIQNTCKRLELLYKDNYSISQGPDSDGLYVTDLNIVLI